MGTHVRYSISYEKCLQHLFLDSNFLSNRCNGRWLYNALLIVGESDHNLGLVVTKPVFGVSEKVRFKSVSSVENRNFTCSKLRYCTLQNPNNKGADQTAQMRRLVCTCVVRKPSKTGFLASRPI